MAYEESIKLLRNQLDSVERLREYVLGEAEVRQGWIDTDVARGRGESKDVKKLRDEVLGYQRQAERLAPEIEDYRAALAALGADEE